MTERKLTLCRQRHSKYWRWCWGWQNRGWYEEFYPDVGLLPNARFRGFHKITLIVSSAKLKDANFILRLDHTRSKSVTYWEPGCTETTNWGFCARELRRLFGRIPTEIYIKIMKKFRCNKNGVLLEV